MFSEVRNQPYGFLVTELSILWEYQEQKFPVFLGVGKKMVGWMTVFIAKVRKNIKYHFNFLIHQLGNVD